MGETVQDVRPAINRRRMLDLAADLIRIPSENPPGAEAAVGEYLVAFFRRLGIEPVVQEVAPGRPNVLVRLEGTQPGPHLIFNGHIDVVPPGPGWTVDPYGAEIRDGRLFGRGSADMKGGVAAMIEAALTVHQGSPFRGAITLAMVADEEEGGGGTRHAVQHGLRGDWAIIPEPTDLRPVIAHKGDFNFYVTVHGRAAHGSVPEQGVNAIYGAGRLLSAIQALNERLATRAHPLVGRPTFSVGTINGGEITCMVPSRCRVAIDRRVIPGERPDDVIAEMQALLDRLARDDPEFRAEMTVPIKALPMEVAPDLPVVLALRDATRRVVGKDPGVSGWSATCDASILAQEAGTPTVIFGPGSIAQAAHRPDESVSVEDLIACADIYALAILDLLGADPARSDQQGGS
jgi:acetylornithine deacetylase/succinyl-diaminopimelate desuccinylase family protein